MTPEKRAYNRTYYLAHREKLMAYQRAYNLAHPGYSAEGDKLRHKRRREEKQKLVNDHKEGKSCPDCWLSFPPVCMDFDHLPGREKTASISVLVGNDQYTCEDVQREIEKCELVCANCHRIRTQARRTAV